MPGPFCRICGKRLVKKIQAVSRAPRCDVRGHPLLLVSWWLDDARRALLALLSRGAGEDRGLRLRASPAHLASFAHSLPPPPSGARPASLVDVLSSWSNAPRVCGPPCWEAGQGRTAAQSRTGRDPASAD